MDKNQVKEQIALNWTGTLAGTLTALEWPVAYGTAYDWAHNCTEFIAELAKAQEMKIDALEDHALTTALAAGPSNNQTLTMFMLSGNRPHKYRPNTTTAEETATAVLDKLKELGRSTSTETEVDTATPSKALVKGTDEGSNTEG